MAALGEALGPMLLALLAVNLKMTATAIVVALPIACLFALARLSRHPLIYWPATVYVNLLRSSPLLMILFWAYYTGPMLTGRPSSAYVAATVALTAFEVAYLTEIVRAGLQSIPVSQRRAGLATGLTAVQVNRFVILPQALRRMLPSLLTQTVIAFQDSTIASIIGVPDIAQVTTIVNARENRPIELYAALAAIYFAICYALSRVVRTLEARTLRRIAGARPAG